MCLTIRYEVIYHPFPINKIILVYLIEPNRTPIARLGSVIVHNLTPNTIWSIAQNQMFDYQTVDSRSQSNLRLPDSCLFDFYV